MNLKILLSAASILLFTSCRPGKTLAATDKSNKELVDKYFLVFNNRKPSHKLNKIVVVADSLYTKSRYKWQYTFFLNLDIVEKLQNYGGEVSHSTLILDSLKTDNNQKVVLLSPFEKTVFQKVIYFSDSLKLHNLSYIRNLKGFKLQQ